MQCEITATGIALCRCFKGQSGSVATYRGSIGIKSVGEEITDGYILTSESGISASLFNR